MNHSPYKRGLIVFVPFPFTDLTQLKQRPAVVISPNSFTGENVILCAVSSKTSSTLKPWEIFLNTSDTENEHLPKPSVIKVDRLFTMHSSRVIRVLDSLKPQKIDELMEQLKRLFS